MTAVAGSMSQKYASEREYLRDVINDILNEKGDTRSVERLSDETSLTEDFGLDSLDLAEVTVRIEDRYGVDIFEDDIVDEVGEVLQKIET
jgi:acyl carrier protein